MNIVINNLKTAIKSNLSIATKSNIHNGTLVFYSNIL